MKRNQNLLKEIWTAKGQRKVLLHEKMLGREYKEGGEQYEQF